MFVQYVSDSEWTVGSPWSSRMSNLNIFRASDHWFESLQLKYGFEDQLYPSILMCV